MTSSSTPPSSSIKKGYSRLRSSLRARVRKRYGTLASMYRDKRPGSYF
ncbi:MAG: hypothetical protein ACUVR0_04415 [Candidatus Aminicenantales bacterium]